MKISPDSHGAAALGGASMNCRIVETALLSLGVEQFRKFLAEPLE